MSTETDPQAPPPAQTTDPNDEARKHYEDAARAAEEARRRYEELAAKAAAPAPAPPPPPAAIPDSLLSEIEEIKKQRARAAETRAIDYAKQQGLKPELAELPREELVKLIPIVDPETEEGRTAFEAWRTQRPRAFEVRGPTLAQTQAAFAPRIEALKAKNTRLINPEAAFAGRKVGL